MNWIKKSLFAKLLIGALLTVMLPLTISNIISYKSNYAAVKKQILDLNIGAIHMGMQEVKDCVDEWQQIALTIYSSDIIYFLSSREPFTAVQRYYIYEELETMCLSAQEIQAVVYDSLPNGDSLYYSKSDFEVNQVDRSDLSPIIPGYNHALSSILDEETGQTTSVLYRHAISNVPGYDNLGTLTIFLRPDKLGNISDALIDQSPDSAVFIYAGDAAIPLFTSGPLPQDMPDLTDIPSDGNVPAQLNDHKGILIVYKEIYKGVPLSLVKFIPETVINTSATSTLRNALLIQLFTIPFILLLVLVLTLMIVSPIRRLADNMEKLEMGDYEFEVPAGPRDELGNLEMRFQIMARRIDTLINKEYRNILEISKARLKVLQAQINPHFLYNMLQYISTMALKKGAADVSEKISELGSIFRYNMENEQEVVALHEEIRHIEEYMALQTGRFDNRIHFSISCPDEALDITIPRMILQPLVENSIKHGIEKGEGRGSIYIAISLEDMLRIRVIDNGRGIDPRTIENIRTRYADYTFSQESGRGIGVINVLERLKIYAGDSFTWSIASQPYVATDITLEIPIPCREDSENEGADR